MTIATLRTAALAALVMSAAGALYGAEPDSEERVTRSAAGFAKEHAADELRDPRSLEERRVQPSEVQTKPRMRAQSAVPPSAAVAFGESWVYEGSTDPFYDFDGDGYFHYLRVRFDVDTIYEYRYVYAMLFVSADGNSWEHLFTTDDFAVWGTDPEDDYEIETELVSGYSTGLYDVLLEIYDADTQVLVDEFGPNESSEFSLVPLEDSTRDGLDPPLPPPPPVDDGGGGAVSWWMLAALSLLAGAARVRRRRV